MQVFGLSVYLDSCVCIIENDVMLSVCENIKVLLVSFVLVLYSSLLITSVSKDSNN